MVKLSRIFKDYADSGALHALVGVQAAIDDRFFLTKGGVLLGVLALEGVDEECLDPEQLDHVSRRLEAALRPLDHRYRLYQYQLKRRRREIEHATPDDEVVAAAVRERARYLESREPYTIECYWVVAHEGWSAHLSKRRGLGDLLASPISALRSSLWDRARIEALNEELDRAREALSHRLERLVVELEESLGLRLLSKDEAFRFLHRLLNFAPHKNAAARLNFDSYVDYQLAGSALECHRDHLRLDNDYVRVLTVKEPPPQTRAALLSRLHGIPSESTLVTEWKSVPSEAVRAEIRSKRRHFHNSRVALTSYLSSAAPAPGERLVDQGASAMADDLGACLAEMETTGATFGHWSLSIVIFDSDPKRLSRSVAECFKIYSALEIGIVEETYNQLNAFLATIPGNDLFNLRRGWLSSANHADLSLIHAPWEGERGNAALRAEYLAAFETSAQTIHYFNLHHHDIAHTLMLGASGSGKSFTLGFLLTHLQKYAPRTFILDLGGSYESVTRLFGGSYLAVDLARPAISINPFRLPLTPDNHRFLLSFVRVLAESGGYELSPSEERDLHEQIENLYAVEPEQRRLRTLVGILNRNLRERLLRWVEGGPYASLFDNVEDTLSFARFQTFDFEGMDKNPQMLEPLFFYLLHRAHDAISDPEAATTFKVLAIDEAWRFLRHPAIRNYVREAFKTWRKKNAAVILATQSSDDLLASELLPVVVESCPTKLFLSNPGADLVAYREAFHLNQTEAALIASLTPKRQILVKRPDRSKVLNLEVGAKDYWLYTNNPLDNHERREALAKHGFAEALESLARSAT